MANPKYDPNTEIFQMRAQWKKVDNCRQLWHERWSWLLDERKRTLEEAEAIKSAAAAALPRAARKEKLVKTLKPVPHTTTGFVGWLAAKFMDRRTSVTAREFLIESELKWETIPDCQLEIYTPWLAKIPLRAPDPWDLQDYHAYKE